MENQTIIQVDAFTDTPFKGNPAAICVLTHPRDDQWMQAVAAEMNLSETAFITPHEDPFKRAWRLRWFTPLREIRLCGHGTLASAHALWTERYLRPDEAAKFDTLSGRLTCTRDASGWITMDFPVVQRSAEDMPTSLFSGLGITAKPAFRALYGDNDFAYLVELDSADELRALRPNMDTLAQLPARSTIVTALSDDPAYDFVTRVFGPAVGNPEDPVTGSAHCALTPYWAEKLGKTEMVAYQTSKRGGVLKLSLRDDRVYLQGQAVTVLKGTLVNT